MDSRNSTIKMDQIILNYSTFIFFPIGILINIFQIIFFFRKKYFKTTMGPYFIAISSNNIIALSMTIMRFIRLEDFYTQFSQVSLSCKIIPFMTRMAFQACSWLNFLYTLDRAIFVLFPTFYNKFNHKNLIVLLLFLFIYFLLVVFNLPNIFFDIKTIKLDEKNETISVCTASVVVNLLRELLSQMVGIYIPFLLMLATNLFLIWKVVESKRKLKIIKELNFATPLIFSNIFFLLFQLPFSAYLIYSMILTLNPELHLNERFKTFMQSLDTISRVIASINYSFYLLVQAILNKTSQRDFKQIINLVVSKCFGNKSKIFPSSKTTEN